MRHPLLEELVAKHRPDTKDGKVADYISALSRQDPSLLGIATVTPNQKVMYGGDAPTVSFTLQSISKVISLVLALMDHGEETVFSQVGMEPTGDPFNSLYKLEMMSPPKPLNPMINAGAMVVSSLVKGSGVEDRVGRLLDLVRAMADNPEIEVDEEVFRSEYETAHRNRSIAYFLKEYDQIDDVEETLQVYVRQCAIRVTCEDLARIGLSLAQYGRSVTGEQIIPQSIARLVKTFMVTCGMYNASGEFAIRVGIPAKSGVSGGILASVPGKMGIGIFSPALDDKGNSRAGVRLLQSLSQAWQLSIF
ncbi:glutaminase A [Polycladomyces subterraneus]|uniref:Glutaminase n=1 Tax=Polycladomyces subterraneus TaxID=1016997 RepID=A0ABT8IRE1_9BACL|nr:glutaminase A [Polycladomyces subterraneus]MDN4595315.1 glutaminase A [Polycladomyces subterraneus]